MASRILHLAVTELLLRELPFADPLRLKVGSILPDAPNTPQGLFNSHFKIRRSDGKKKYDLEAFRREFGENLAASDLCLGYYLHLIQDTVFRRFVYDIHHWDPHHEGNPQRLHGDYARLNPFVIERFGLQCDIDEPDGFIDEPLQARFQFDLSAILADYRGDFVPIAPSEAFFFTDEMAETYIAEAAEVCQAEVAALRSGDTSTEIVCYAWQ